MEWGNGEKGVTPAGGLAESNFGGINEQILL